MQYRGMDVIPIREGLVARKDVYSDSVTLTPEPTLLLALGSARRSNPRSLNDLRCLAPHDRCQVWSVYGVQNGARHAWRNKSDRPCTMAIVLVGADAG